MTTKKSALDRLSEELEEKDEQIAELEEELAQVKEDQEYEEEWRWRHIRKLTEEENLGLPVPRLELRYREKSEYRLIIDYGLINRHLSGHLEFIPFGSTEIHGKRDDKDHFSMPFRGEGHIRNDLWELNLPAYLIRGTKVLPITNDDPGDIPNGLADKIKKRVLTVRNQSGD